MLLDIKNKEVEVRFGIKFIRELDKSNYFVKVHKVWCGSGAEGSYAFYI